MNLDMRPPGVHAATKDRRYTPVVLAKSGVVGFVGITQKGPTNEPVRVTSLDQFRRVFGALKIDSYLEHSVSGFFENGGRECQVLRVCHLSEGGSGEVASTARVLLRDQLDRPTVIAEALNEGTWGNEIQLKVKRPEARVQTLLTLDVREGERSAKVQSTHGFRRGTVVKVYDEEHAEYRTVADVDGTDRVLQWRIDEPLKTSFRSNAPTYIEPMEFELEVRTLTKRESFRDLSMAPSSDNYFVRVVNAQSDLVRLTDLRTEGEIQDRYPIATELTALTGGKDGIFNITADDFIGMNLGPNERYGLAAFEAVETIDLLAVPDLLWAVENSSGFRTASGYAALRDVEAVQQAMVSQCERMRDRFAILDLPNHRNFVHALQWRLQFDTAYAAFYYPWIVVDHHGKRTSIPPSGHVAGIFARCDYGLGTHRAPANEELKGVIDLEVLLLDGDIGTLNGEGVNCIKAFNKRGLRVWGARTASSDPQNRYINVRRSISTIIRSISQNLQWVVFEPNDPKLWKSISSGVGYFLMTLWKAGYFKGNVPEDAFYVKCDDETNPPESRDAGFVVVEVGVAPVRPAEFIVFRVAEENAEIGPVAEQ